jgi:hypothetical protein
MAFFNVAIAMFIMVIGWTLAMHLFMHWIILFFLIAFLLVVTFDANPILNGSMSTILFHFCQLQRWHQV